MAHIYTEEQKEFIAKNVPGKTGAELTELVNKQFELNLSVSQVNSFKKNYGLKSGLSGCFQPGAVPYNKGKKFPNAKKNAGQFKKGRLPHNHKPIGTERVNGDGYIDIKIADPNKWKGKHQIIWEEVNGPIPKGYAVIFADRDSRNFDIENLICLSKRQLLTMNRNKLVSDNAELTRTGLIMADIYNKITDRKRK